ncbi:hypothetical protein Q7P37_000076 [Cladosporium fusiforme]
MEPLQDGEQSPNTESPLIDFQEQRAAFFQPRSRMPMDRIPIERSLDLDRLSTEHSKLAAFKSTDETFGVYRRFGYLQARLLLEKQDQLRVLENRLGQLGVVDHANHEPDHSQQRQDLIRQIRRGFNFYSAALRAYRPSSLEFTEVRSDINRHSPEYRDEHDRSSTETNSNATRVVYEPSVPARLEGKPVSAFPDTGADTNYLSFQCARRHGFTARHHSKGRVKVANGALASVMGSMTLPFSFEGETEVHHLKFEVLRQCRFDIVLGSSFLKLTKTFTHFKHRVQEKIRNVFSHRVFKHKVFSLGSRQYVNGWANGIYVGALPDTGADVSVMSASFAKKHGFDVDTSECHRVVLEFADGSTATTTGIVKNVQWRYGSAGDDNNLDVYVFDGLADDFILGYDFLSVTHAFERHEGDFWVSDRQGSGMEWIFNIIKFVGKVLKGSTSRHSLTSPNGDQQVFVGSFGEQKGKELDLYRKAKVEAQRLPEDQRAAFLAASMAQCKQFLQSRPAESDSSSQSSSALTPPASSGSSEAVPVHAPLSIDNSPSMKRPWFSSRFRKQHAFEPTAITNNHTITCGAVGCARGGWVRLGKGFCRAPFAALDGGDGDAQALGSERRGAWSGWRMGEIGRLPLHRQCLRVPPWLHVAQVSMHEASWVARWVWMASQGHAHAVVTGGDGVVVAWKRGGRCADGRECRGMGEMWDGEAWEPVSQHNGLLVAFGVAHMNRDACGAGAGDSIGRAKGPANTLDSPAVTENVLAPPASQVPARKAELSQKTRSTQPVVRCQLDHSSDQTQTENTSPHLTLTTSSHPSARHNHNNNNCALLSSPSLPRSRQHHLPFSNRAIPTTSSLPPLAPPDSSDPGHDCAVPTRKHTCA